MNKNDGGPAFPTPEPESDYPLPGMSLRDWFAGQALPAIMAMAAEMAKNGKPLPLTYIADQAFEHADAMLKARGETHD